LRRGPYADQATPVRATPWLNLRTAVGWRQRKRLIAAITDSDRAPPSPRESGPPTARRACRCLPARCRQETPEPIRKLDRLDRAIRSKSKPFSRAVPARVGWYSLRAPVRSRRQPSGSNSAGRVSASQAKRDLAGGLALRCSPKGSLSGLVRTWIATDVASSSAVGEIGEFVAVIAFLTPRRDRRVGRGDHVVPSRRAPRTCIGSAGSCSRPQVVFVT
jgi:hypothetical protein